MRFVSFHYISEFHPVLFCAMENKAHLAIAMSVLIPSNNCCYAAVNAFKPIYYATSAMRYVNFFCFSVEIRNSQLLRNFALINFRSSGSRDRRITQAEMNMYVYCVGIVRANVY